LGRKRRTGKRRSFAERFRLNISRSVEVELAHTILAKLLKRVMSVSEIEEERVRTHHRSRGETVLRLGAAGAAGMASIKTWEFASLHEVEVGGEEDVVGEGDVGSTGEVD
jgi:hypothetical protein